MKILMASSFFASHNGGLERVAGELFRAFADRGQEIVWMAGDVTPPPEPTGKSRTVRLHIFNFVEDKIGVPFPIPAPSALRQINREVKNADILILHDCLYLSNILTFLAARWRGIPTIIIQHTRYFPNESPLVNAVIKTCTAIVTKPMLSHTSQVVFIGETTKDFFGGLRFKRPPEVIFNGVDTEVFRMLEGSETVPVLRREYCLPEKDVVILFVGRFVVKKGLSVMKRMVDARPDWTWAFAGWGPLDPTRWNAPNVRVFSGLSGASLAPLYRCCDLLVLPSIGEGGFPLVAREALASGMPVVCSEETLRADHAMGQFALGASVYLEDEHTTSLEFLTAIEKALCCGTKLVNRFQKNKSMAVVQNSWNWTSDQYLELIFRLIPGEVTTDIQPKMSAESGCG